MAMPSRTSDEWTAAAAAVRVAGERLGVVRARSGIGDAFAFALGIAVGGTVGAIAALLTAPVEGPTLRARLRASLGSLRGSNAIVPSPETAPATITLTTIRPTDRR